MHARGFQTPIPGAQGTTLLRPADYKTHNTASTTASKADWLRDSEETSRLSHQHVQLIVSTESFVAMSKPAGRSGRCQVHLGLILPRASSCCASYDSYDVRLVKLAMVDGFALHQTAVKDSWQHYLGDFLHGHLGQQQLFHNFDVASVIERAKHQHAFEYFADVQHSSLMLYRTMQPEYKSAKYSNAC